MSAENQLAVYHMANGQFWVGVRRCGDTVIQYYGCSRIIARHDSYAEALDAIHRMDDEDSEEYVYTEHGARIPSEEALRQEPPRFLRSEVVVRFTGRPCDCLDFRDLREKRWQVAERDTSQWYEEGRVIGTGLWYAQAITMANLYSQSQPGECSLRVPQVFYDLGRTRAHDCLQLWPPLPKDGWQLT